MGFKGIEDWKIRGNDDWVKSLRVDEVFFWGFDTSTWANLLVIAVYFQSTLNNGTCSVEFLFSPLLRSFRIFSLFFLSFFLLLLCFFSLLTLKWEETEQRIKGKNKKTRNKPISLMLIQPHIEIHFPSFPKKKKKELTIDKERKPKLSCFQSISLKQYRKGKRRITKVRNQKKKKKKRKYL